MRVSVCTSCKGRMRCKGKFRIVIRNRKHRYTISLLCFYFRYSLNAMCSTRLLRMGTWCLCIEFIVEACVCVSGVGNTRCTGIWVSNRRSDSHHPSNHMRFGCLIRAFYCLIWFGAWLIFAGTVVLCTDATHSYLFCFVSSSSFFFVHFASNIQHLFSINFFFAVISDSRTGWWLAVSRVANNCMPAWQGAFFSLIITTMHIVLNSMQFVVRNCKKKEQKKWDIFH